MNILCRTGVVLLLASSLAGCDPLYDLLEIPNPKENAQKESDAQAIGAACRYSGRSLEDCYTLNPEYSKTDIYVGWREMNGYMTENDIQPVPSLLVPGAMMTPEAAAERAARDAENAAPPPAPAAPGEAEAPPPAVPGD